MLFLCQTCSYDDSDDRQGRIKLVSWSEILIQIPIKLGEKAENTWKLWTMLVFQKLKNTLDLQIFKKAEQSVNSAVPGFFLDFQD